MKNVKRMVKGIAVLVVVVGLMAGGVSSSHALTTSSSLATSISVNSVFRLTLATWRGVLPGESPTIPSRFDLTPIASLNFGNVTVGQVSPLTPSVIVTTTGTATAESGLILKAESNQGNVWRFQVSENQPLTRTGGSQTIADANFRYFTWTAPGEATEFNRTILPLQNPDGSRFNSMSTTPFTLYTSTSGEGFTSDTRIHMQFLIAIPSVTPGTYTNSVIITMVE